MDSKIIPRYNKNMQSRPNETLHGDKMSVYTIHTVAFSSSYLADSKKEALDLFAKDAGYDSYDDLLCRTPDGSETDLKIEVEDAE